MFDNFNVTLRKNKGFLTYMSYIPIPEYGQSNAPLAIQLSLHLFRRFIVLVFTTLSTESQSEH